MWEHIHDGLQQHMSESILEGFETSTVGRNETWLAAPSMDRRWRDGTDKSMLFFLIRDAKQRAFIA